MTSYNHNTIMLSATSTIVSIALVLSIVFLANVPADQERIIDLVTENAVRLEALEQKRSPATSKRFNSDDARDLIRCLKTPYPERDRCLDEIVKKLDYRETVTL